MSKIIFHRKNERGSALFFILIAVVLFGALSYTVAGMMRSGDPSFVSEERAGLLAGDIINYGRQLKQAVQGMKISNGCSDTAISFQNNSISGYTNGANTACQVFNPAGGDMNYMKADPDATNQSWYFTGGTVVQGMGTTCTTAACTDLMAVLSGISDSVCSAINDRLGLDDAAAVNVTDDIAMSAPFTGSYAYATSFLGDGTAVNLRNVSSGCFISAGTPAPAGTRVFFQVLLPR